MRLKLLATAAALALAASAGAANALNIVTTTPGMTWDTALEFSQAGQGGPWGNVHLVETDASDVLVTVTIDPAEFVTASGYMFTFNLYDPSHTNVVTVNDEPGGVQASQVTYQTPKYDFPVSTLNHNNPDYSQPGFGHWDNAFLINCNQKNNVCTGANGLDSPFQFNVHNDNGITFAGVGAQYDADTGKLVSLGTGNHFFSNSDGTPYTGAPTGGWWFAADTLGTGGCTDTSASATCIIAGRDAITGTSVPEPGLWAMMIVGFGGMGAMMRRRRARAIA